jgi:hypothetical protein
MRVGPDIGASWDRVVRCARPATLMYFLNGRVWHNDPDCIMLRDPLTLDNGRAWASFVALSGQLNLVSEWLPDLPPEKLDAYKRTIPNHGKTTARPVDLFQRDMPRIWQLTSGTGDDRIDVVGLFNWNAPPRPATRRGGAAMEEPTTQAVTKLETGPVTIQLDSKQLGLPTGEYVAFDYWGNQFLPAISGPTSFELPPGSCKVIALRRKLDRPQVVSTSRHVTQGVADLWNCTWDAAAGVLRGTSQVVGGEEYELRIDPAGRAVERVEIAGDASAATVESRRDGKHLRVTLKSPATRELAWAVQFGGVK